MNNEKKSIFEPVKPGKLTVIDENTRELIIDICLSQIREINTDIELAGNAMMYIAEDDIDGSVYSNAVKMYRNAKRKKKQVVELLDKMTGGEK